MLRAGDRLRARPRAGAVGSTLLNTRNLGRTFRKTPRATGPLQDRESSIIPPSGTALFAKLQNTWRPTWRATEYSHPRRHSYGTSCMRARPVRDPSGWSPSFHRSQMHTTLATMAFFNSPNTHRIKPMKKTQKRADTFNTWIFIYNGWGRNT